MLAHVSLRSLIFATSERLRSTVVPPLIGGSCLYGLTRGVYYTSAKTRYDHRKLSPLRPLDTTSRVVFGAAFAPICLPVYLYEDVLECAWRMKQIDLGSSMEDPDGAMSACVHIDEFRPLMMMMYDLF